MFALEEQGMADYLVRREIKERKATIDTELQGLWQRIYRVEARQDQDWRKQERYCREQREVLRALEDLVCKEREMFELDNRKDQVMTICKVALVNLVMWTRDQYFPLTYAHPSLSSHLFIYVRKKARRRSLNEWWEQKNCSFVVLAGFFGYTPFGTLTIHVYPLVSHYRYCLLHFRAFGPKPRPHI